MDQESVRSEKSDRGHHTLLQQPQHNFSGPGSDSHQPLNYVQSASGNCVFSPELQGGRIPLVQPSIFQPSGQISQHPGYNSNWNNSQSPLNPPYISYSSPGMYPQQQCMNMMGWSGPQLMGNCPPSAGYPMQPLAPSSNQTYSLKQMQGQALIPLESGVSVSKLPHGPLSNANTPASSHRGGNQQMEPYCHDENAWVENATAVTGATSETGLSADNMSRYGARYGLMASMGINNGPNSCIGGAAAALIRTEIDDLQKFTCARIFGFLVYFGLGICCIFSPVLMVIFPYLPSVGWKIDSCQPTCEGHLIGMAVKLALLALGTWILIAPHFPLFNGGRTVLPRVRLWRSLFLCLIFVVLFAFWLFYSVRIVQNKETDYGSVVLFSNSLSDALLFLNYAGIALLEFQRMRCQYSVHVVRSPDGASKTYKIDDMSLQKAAMEILQQYMVDFTVFTQQSTSSSSNRRGKRSNNGGGVGVGTGGGNNGADASGPDGGSKYKFYDVDGGRGGGGGVGGGQGDKGVSGGGATAGHTGPSASARLYDEMETEKRVRKRRMRLLLAVEDAFSHAAKMSKENGPPLGRNSIGSDHRGGMSPFHNGNGRLLGQTDAKRCDPYEAAQTVFPTLIRPLQKYMRATRQQSRHPVDSVIDHLAMCITYGLSPLTFMERFNPSSSTPQQDAATAASALSVARNISVRHRRTLTIAGPTDGEGRGGGGYKPPTTVAPGGQQTWQIVADRALSRDISDGVVFQLKRHHGSNCEISLLCTIHRLPLLQLFEGSFEVLFTGIASTAGGSSPPINQFAHPQQPPPHVIA